VGHEILVTLTRSGRGESHHHGTYCVVEGDRVLRSRGDIEVPVFMRSAAKPFQAVTVVRSGAPDRFGFSDEELAMVVGSHSGSPRHSGNARSMLAKAGADPVWLRCGGHRPLDRSVYEDYVRRGFVWDRLEDNCSGKHAGMIAAATVLGEDPESYAEPGHAVQRHNRDVLARFAGIDPGDIAVGVDGCAVPSFAVPVEAMARAMAAFVSPGAARARDGDVSGPDAEAADRVHAVVNAHPEMIAGDGRFDTRVIRAGRGNLLSKEGAEGVLVAGAREQGLGFAVKIADGAARAAQALMAALLVEHGLVPAADVAGLYPRIVRTREGDPCGEYEVHL